MKTNQLLNLLPFLLVLLEKEWDMNNIETKVKWEWVLILLIVILVMAFCMHP